MKVIEKLKQPLIKEDILNNIETALKSSFYMHFRYIYNNTRKFNLTDEFKSAVFFFIRNFAYSGMFRYNSKGEFNVPYGGMGYNRKRVKTKIDYLKSNQLANLFSITTFGSQDFEEFLNIHEPQAMDFMFLDPPYDSEFSTYTKNEFSKIDQTRLANYLVNECKCKWMLIIKDTPFVYDLYKDSGLEIINFEKKYLVSFMNRNNKDATHLLIRNYK